MAHGTDPEGWPAETRAAVDALHEQRRELEGRFDAITRAARWGESGDGSVEGPAVGGSYGYDPDLDAPRFWPSGEPRMTKREAEQRRRWVEEEDLRKQRDTDGGVTYPYGRA